MSQRQFRLTVRDNEIGEQTSSSLEDSTVIVISLGFEDRNSIKYFTDLAISNDSTYISFSNATIDDMNDNPVIAIPSNNATQVGLFTEDTTSPMLVRFNLDMNEGLCFLPLIETVNSSSLYTSAITLRSSADGQGKQLHFRREASPCLIMATS